MGLVEEEKSLETILQRVEGARDLVKEVGKWCGGWEIGGGSSDHMLLVVACINELIEPLRQKKNVYIMQIENSHSSPK